MEEEKKEDTELEGSVGTELEKTVTLESLTLETTAARIVNKQDYFKFLNMNLDKYDMPVDLATAQKWKAHMMALKTGLHAVAPLVCAGPRCPINAKCPLVVRDNKGLADHQATHYPLGKACPVEKEILQNRIMELCEEFDISPTQATDLSIVTRIATLDLYDYRATVLLSNSEHGGFIIDEVVGSNPRTGEYYTNMHLNPIFELKEKIHRMRQDLIKSMIGTRKEKINAQAKMGESKYKTDLSRTLSDLKLRIDQIKRANVPQIIDIEDEDDMDSESLDDDTSE